MFWHVEFAFESDIFETYVLSYTYNSLARGATTLKFEMESRVKSYIMWKENKYITNDTLFTDV